jgi:arylsulfatase A-like enzyme
MIFRSSSVGYESNHNLPGHLLHRIATLLLAAVGVALALCSGQIGSGAEKRSAPNVVLIVADDMGFSDAGCYGGEIRTPNLDRLAKGGVRFTQFYNTARCWPSRASILTGYYAQQVRRDGLPGSQVGGAGGKRPAWARLLPELLRPLGYRSYHCGKWHVDGTPLAGGFDRSFDYTDTNHHFLPAARYRGDDRPLEPLTSDEGYYASTAVADHAIRQLRDHSQKYAGRPFFLYLAFTEPHFPVQAPREEIDGYRRRYLAGWDALRHQRWQRMTAMGLVNCPLSPLDPDIVPSWNLSEKALQARIGPGEAARAIPWSRLTPEQQQFQPVKMAIHAAMIHRMDSEIGRVLDQLHAMDAFENTLIFFLSDNGASAEQTDPRRRARPHRAARLGEEFPLHRPGLVQRGQHPFSPAQVLGP